jgi:hypothetical protein
MLPSNALFMADSLPFKLLGSKLDLVSSDGTVVGQSSNDREMVGSNPDSYRNDISLKS